MNITQFEAFEGAKRTKAYGSVCFLGIESLRDFWSVRLTCPASSLGTHLLGLPFVPQNLGAEFPSPKMLSLFNYGRII